MVHEKRRHKRYSLDIMEINGTMVFANRFEIIDISAGGVALKTDRRLNIGKEYLIRLGNKRRKIDVKGNVIRCELSTIETRPDGEGVSIYTAAMMFKDIPPSTIHEFINSSERLRKEVPAASSDRRLHVRFFIVTAGETTLKFPLHFKVKMISLGGMLIEADNPLEKESRIPMGLSLQDTQAPISFTGRVATCAKMAGSDPFRYEIGVEFTELTDKDKKVLETFVEYLSAMEQKKGA